MQNMKRQSGFTLVEIAIVLVIIGLLLGGILKGQEMITQARIKNVINDFNGITAAYTSYQDRYRAIPGDDARAAGRWTGSVSGDGNGTVAGAYNAQPAAPAAPVTTEESNLFWWHLRSSGFIPGPTTGVGVGAQPTNAVGGMIGVQSGGGPTPGPGTLPTMGFSGLVVCSANVPDKIAIAIDTQIDDQTAATGSLRANLQTVSNGATTLILPTDVYQETGNNQYLMCKTM